MINSRAVRGLVVLAVLVVGCTPTASPGSSLGPTAGAAATTTPTTATTPAPAPTGKTPYHAGSLVAGTYEMTPFYGLDSSGLCMSEEPACKEDPADDTIRLTLTIPSGYQGIQRPLIWGPDGDVGLIILRGSGLYSDPCHSTPPPDIAVGPTVDDFATAIADHPLLDATTPVDVTLAGYKGKYIDLDLPHDVASCTDNFWPYEPGVYAQGADHRWHLWILDVDGIRVVIQSMDYARVPEARRAELQAIVDSIEIKPR